MAEFLHGAVLAAQRQQKRPRELLLAQRGKRVGSGVTHVRALIAEARYEQIVRARILEQRDRPADHGAHALIRVLYAAHQPGQVSALPKLAQRKRRSSAHDRRGIRQAGHQPLFGGGAYGDQRLRGTGANFGILVAQPGREKFHRARVTNLAQCGAGGCTHLAVAVVQHLQQGDGRALIGQFAESLAGCKALQGLVRCELFDEEGQLDQLQHGFRSAVVRTGQISPGARREY